jgi:Rho termination factor, N-terminal domain
MTLKDIRVMAQNLRVKNYSRYRKKALIRAIQQEEGNSPCFKEIPGCCEHECLWRPECQE